MSYEKIIQIGKSIIDFLIDEERIDFSEKQDFTYTFSVKANSKKNDLKKGIYDISIFDTCLTLLGRDKMAKSKWIQSAVKKMEEKGTKGSFTRKAKKAGGEKKGGGIKSSFIEKELNSKNPNTRKKAQFAKNMKGLGK